MLKYIKRAYIMSIASYETALGEGPRAVEDTKTKEEKNFLQKFEEYKVDGKISQYELSNLRELYINDKDKIKQSTFNEKREEVKIIMAQNLIKENPEGLFEVENKKSNFSTIEVDKSFSLFDDETSFNEVYAFEAKKFGITANDIYETIKTITNGSRTDTTFDKIGKTADKVEKGFSKSMGTLAENGTNAIGEKYKNAQEGMVDASVAVMDGVDATKRNIQETADKTVIAIADSASDIIDSAKKRQDETSIAQNEPVTPTSTKKPAKKPTEKPGEVLENGLRRDVNSVIDNNLNVTLEGKGQTIHYREKGRNFYFNISNHEDFVKDADSLNKWIKDKEDKVK